MGRVCADCNQDMGVADGCTVGPGRIRWGQETLLANRVQFAMQRGVDDPFNNPVPMDDPEADRWFRMCSIGPHVGDRRCPDCNAKPGELHHPGCDTEECPVCHLQAIGDDCGGWVQAIEGRLN